MKREYCPECGARILSDSKFCMSCGTKLIKDHETYFEGKKQAVDTTEEKSNYRYYGKNAHNQGGAELAEIKKTHRRLLDSSSISYFIWGGIIFAICGVLNIAISLSSDSTTLSTITTVAELVGLALMVLGLQQFTTLENKADNPGEKAKIIFGIYVVLSLGVFLLLQVMGAALAVNILGDVSQITPNQANQIINDLFNLIVLASVSTIIVEIVGVFGAIYFTRWFEYVAYSYQAEHTNSFTWMFVLRAIVPILIVLGFNQFHNAIMESSGDPTAVLDAGLGLIVLFFLAAICQIVAGAFQIMAGYKVYTAFRDAK